ILKAQFVEIVAADIDVEILAPIVLYPLVHDGTAGNEILDAIGAVAQWRLEGGRADLALLACLTGALPPVLRQDIELADDERHFPVLGRIEDESDLALAGLLHLRNMAI